MPSSLDRGSADEDFSTPIPQTPCVSELIELLDRGIKDAGPDESILFPSHVVESLLRIKSSIGSRHLDKLASILDGHRERIIQILHISSLHCLACVLLNSDSTADQERALCLLLERRQSPANTAAETPQAESLSLSSTLLQLIESTLIATLYAKLNSRAENIKSRIWAGKLLVEILGESNANGELLLQQGLVFVFSHETDITLRFFAGAVIRSLYLSGTRDDLLWVPDNTIHRSTFFRSLQEFPKDWIQSFYHYICEVQRSLSDGASERLSSVYLIQSVLLGTKIYAADSLLATTTSETLIFIVAARKAPSQYFQLIEIPLRYILHSATDRDDAAEGRDLDWRLRLDAAGFYLVDGKKQYLDGSTLCMSSDNDLTEILAEIDTIGQKGQNSDTWDPHARNTETQVSVKLNERKVAKEIISLVSENPKAGSASLVSTAGCNDSGKLSTLVKPRRFSSIVVSLDSGDEVAKKSAQNDRGLSQAGKGYTPNEGMSDEISTGIWTIPNSRSDSVSEEKRTSAEDGKERAADFSIHFEPARVENPPRMEQNDAQPTAGLERPPSKHDLMEGKDVVTDKNDEGHEGILQTASPHVDDSLASTQMQNQTSKTPNKTHVTSIAQCSTSPLDAIGTDTKHSQMENAADHDPAPLAGQKSPHDEPKKETAKEVLSKRESPTKIKRLSVSRKTRTRFPNTQESLLFPRLRRSKRKVYTANSKAAVDWDEDLRPSDDDRGVDVQNSVELTSVSSPCSSAAGRRINFSGKRKVKPKGSTTNKRTKQVKKNTKTAKVVRRSPRKSLRTRRANDDKARRGASSPQNSKISQEGSADRAEYAESGQSGAYDLNKIENAREDSPHQNFSDHNSTLAAKDNGLECNAIDPPCSAESPLESGLHSLPGLELSVLDWDGSIFSENDCGLSSPPVAKADSTLNDQAQESGLKRSGDGGECPLHSENGAQSPAPNQGGRGQAIGGKLAAALGDFFSRDTPSNNASKPDANIALDSAEPQVTLQVSSESVKQAQSPQEPPESSIQGDTPEELPGLTTQDETEVRSQGDDTDRVATSAATDIVMHDLPADDQTPIILDETGLHLDNETGDQIFEKAVSTSPMRKRRATSHGSADEPLQKKLRTVSFNMPSSHGDDPPTEPAPLLYQESLGSTSKSPLELGTQAEVEEKSSWAVEKDRYFNMRKLRSRAPDSENAVDMNTPQTPGRKYSPPAPKGVPRSRPKNTIVDENGSPRLASRRLIVHLKGMGLKDNRDETKNADVGKLEGRGTLIEEDSSVCEYDDDSNVDFEEDLSVCGIDFSPVGQRLSFVERLRVCREEANPPTITTPIDSKNEPMPPPTSPSLDKSHKMIANPKDDDPKQETPTKLDSEPQQTPSIPDQSSSIELNSELSAGSTTLVEKDDSHRSPSPIEWETSLQTVQRNAHDMLVNTSKLLMRHLDDERDSINRVLEIYRKGCHSVLGQLFEAQEERIELYRRQVAAVQKHHADLSRDLIHRLEENDRRVQQRLCFESLTSGMEERGKLQSRVGDLLNRYNTALRAQEAGGDGQF